MADLMAWGVAMAAGGKEWKAGGGGDWAVEVDRFFTEFDGDTSAKR